MIRIKRIYEPAEPTDGVRFLVDRLWPRGVSKERASINEWMKDLAPGDELRRQFHHQPEKWDEFRQRYFEELASPGKKPLVDKMLGLARKGTVTLVYAAREPEHNNAVALREFLERLVK